MYRKSFESQGVKMYRLLTNEEKIKISTELNNSPFRVITDGEKIWVLKHNNNADCEKRDLLGFLLGKDFCNVTEVKLLDEQELENIKQFANQEESFNVNNTFLVRLAHSYTLEELSCKILEEAVATELVYSIWIRRRDAHVDNRVYVKGIPIFYDYHVAFLGESDLGDVNTFFSQVGDHGRAGRWRVKILNDFLTRFTRGIHKSEMGAYHYVNDLASFYQLIEKSKTTLREKVPNQLEKLVRQAKFTNTTETQIINLLKGNLTTLDGDVSKMLEIVGKD
ncbi:MAG: hypothetical protein A3E40_00580 [Candidatus Levybacteria bacterium RIFCSPHIGHO2_12_FULL_37_9]|nr:MAG: hypothetical protein A3E40_00580 [Candidatus Levybacteria bacterium RIFCSPHIGHO2_12_FULL_37_9]